LVHATNVNSYKNNETPLQQRFLSEDIKTPDFEKNEVAESKAPGDLDEKLDKQDLEEKTARDVKQVSKEAEVGAGNDG
ncbi:hypothetical protein, partial [Herbidospora sp. RD11066]